MRHRRRHGPGRWHHGHGHHHHRRRRLSPLAYYVRSRLRRRIFVWFGVTIVLSGLVAGAIVGGPWGARGAWDGVVERATTFMGHRFAEVWDEPEARDALARSAAEDLGLGLELRDAAGTTLARAGGECLGRHGMVDTPVVRGGERVGQVHACVARAPDGNGWSVALGLGAALAVLWGASGLIAWRLTRPLARLVEVTRAIGEGRLDTRAHLPRVPDELGLLARAINDMASRIQGQMADQRELLAVVSHEIRTPLGHIRVLLDLARDGGDRGSLDEIEQELLDVDRLVDQLLASSRLDFEQLDRRRLSADELGARALARAELPTELLVLETESVAIDGDPTLLGRALANLVDNAQTHGEGLVALRMTVEGDELCIAAEDAGPGLPEQTRDRLFESFVRGGQGGKLGLGLALVQRIAHAHGGRAFAEDREPRGARVGVCLPLHRA
ncbi:MAG: HAMP domain-containing sensor histidine kinase [Myxococcota bacterium]